MIPILIVLGIALLIYLCHVVIYPLQTFNWTIAFIGWGLVIYGLTHWVMAQ